MRAFLTCHIPEHVRLYLKSLISQLPEAKLIVPRQYDLTIKFLGEVPEERLTEVQNRLSFIHFSPFKATLTNLGVFSERMIRVVWVGLQPAEAFYNLHDLVDTALAPLFPPDERFVPHITLARVKAVKDRKAFLEHLSHIEVESQSFSIDRLILTKSELTSAGASHTTIFETQTMPSS